MSSLQRCGIGVLMKTVGGFGKTLFTAFEAHHFAHRW